MDMNCRGGLSLLTRTTVHWKGEKDRYLLSRTQLSVGWDHAFVNPEWSTLSVTWLKLID